MLQWQTDPAVEELRREMWRRIGHLLLRFVGVPLLLVSVFGAMALLVLLGVVH
jgi:hypothetical protein